jgi:hypothetical protein
VHNAATVSLIVAGGAVYDWLDWDGLADRSCGGSQRLNIDVTVEGAVGQSNIVQ